MSEMITALINPTLTPSPIQPFPSQLPRLNGPEDEVASPFASFFNAAMNVLNDTNTFALEAQQAQLDFATGRLDDILAVQMAIDRMSTSINFTTQVTTRIIEAYREIMRMQI